ncbi:uncharacterized protein EDB93DRAFT_1209954 [Suillus bovinus]|uniref:uncharacterized protein n=1 Tax=Suillus bovinus TaxID=48563 RepID=UPI001B862B10|nr:uncharacterized protein EDB93DRAFT_1209954 [Suillus bovinus]KAG2139601.1 hypothetical protein EDB93DRAFT_1209954 [Suillus bovinus]
MALFSDNEVVECTMILKTMLEAIETLFNVGSLDISSRVLKKVTEYCNTMLVSRPETSMRLPGQVISANGTRSLSLLIKIHFSRSFWP